MSKKSRRYTPPQRDDDYEEVRASDYPEGSDEPSLHPDHQPVAAGMRGARDETRKQRGRKARAPMGGAQPKLKATAPDGMVGHWFNDKPGRIQEALDHDYTFVTSEGMEAEDRSSARSEIVGTHEDGSAMRAYFMAVPREWHAEDQKKKQEKNDEIENEIKHGSIRRAASQDQDAYYVPKEGIRVTVE